jgi:hypothetical protein
MNLDAKPIAVKESPRSNYKFVTYVHHIAGSLKDNASFANVSPSAAAFQAAADKLAADNAAAKGGGPAATAARDAKRAEVELMLNTLVVNVQATVNTAGVDAAGAIAMILSTGLSIKKARVVNKPPLAARHGKVSGDVRLIARAVAKSAVYFWSYSMDQNSWTNVPETMKSGTTISGLTPGQVYYFRFQARTRKGLGDYSDVVKLVMI